MNENQEANDEAARNLVEALFHPDRAHAAHTQDQPITVIASAPIIEGQAKTPEPMTAREANQAVANSSTAGAVGAIFHNNPFHNI